MQLLGIRYHGNGMGYTCDIRLAKIWTAKEVADYATGHFKAYPIANILPLTQHHIDIQDLIGDRKRPWTLDRIETISNKEHP